MAALTTLNSFISKFDLSELAFTIVVNLYSALAVSAMRMSFDVKILLFMPYAGERIQRVILGGVACEKLYY